MTDKKNVKESSEQVVSPRTDSAPGGLMNIEKPEIPNVMPVMPMVELNLFPRMVYPMMVLDEKLMSIVQEIVLKDRMLGLFLLSPGVDMNSAFKSEDFNPIGIAAYILKMSRNDNGSMRVLTQGVSRIKLVELVENDPYATARVEPLEEILKMDKRTEALMAGVRGLFKTILDLSPNMPDDLQMMNQNIDHPGLMADMVASTLNIKREEKQELLATLDIKQRLEKVMVLLERQRDILELGSKIHTQIKGKIDKSQRDYWLREQIKAIQSELGEKDDSQTELDDLKEQLDAKHLPEAAMKAAKKEVDRLARMNPASAEFTVARTYVDWFLDLPWSEETPDRTDILDAQALLEKDHYGLEKVKKRIIEYLSVLKLKPDMKGPILCFVGPPGTGKTSLGKSIASALGRNFIRASLGGVRDEAEIRGHRRTYVGALPGRIIQGMKKAGSINPVFILDEVDKLGGDFRGDPSAALLEVLDPEQNHSFSDHYLEVEYDLSKVMFIATANVLDTIPGPLRDRMEIISLSGYTNEEKLFIAKKFLVPRQREAHGLTAKHITFRDGAIKHIIGDYTREAGVRSLEREIAHVCRAVATRVAKGEQEKSNIKVDDITEILGPAKFENEVRARTAQAGIATGLAWTQSGGDILFIEATAMPGKGGLILTGQLGDVMKESAQAALSYIRSKSKKFGLQDDYFSEHDLHVHVPAGAIPKDGPSAGVTMTTALVSLVTGRRIRPDTAMTGEITLRGLVLPVGGIREKVLAAKRAGIKQVILPKRNERDFSEIPEHLRKGMEVHPVAHFDEVLDLAFQS